MATTKTALRMAKELNAPKERYGDMVLKNWLKKGPTRLMQIREQIPYA